MAQVAVWIITSTPCAVYLIFAASYLLRGRGRREQVQELLDIKAVKDFYKDAYKVDSDEDMGARILPRWTEHLLPLGLYAVITLQVSATAAVAAGLPLGLPSELTDQLARVPPHVLAGFAGAYLWGLLACIERFRVANWTPGFTHGLWVRILIGGVLGAVVAVPFSSEDPPLLAFALGSFPAATVRKWIRHVAAKRLGMDKEDEGAGPKWSVIQGVTPELLERLNEADVASPVALANSDPFRLYLRTNIAWRHVLDLIDQAILTGYVGTKIEALRPLGIRGAIEMALVADRLQRPSPDEEVVKSARATVVKLAKALGHDDNDVTRNLLQNLNEDAQVRLIWGLWFEETGTLPDAPPGVEAPPRRDVTTEFDPRELDQERKDKSG